jgi:hypothetical protein
MPALSPTSPDDLWGKENRLVRPWRICKFTPNLSRREKGNEQHQAWRIVREICDFASLLIRKGGFRSEANGLRLSASTDILCVVRDCRNLDSKIWDSRVYSVQIRRSSATRILMGIPLSQNLAQLAVFAQRSRIVTVGLRASRRGAPAVEIAAERAVGLEKVS